MVLYHGLEALGRQRGRGLAVLALLLVPGYWGYGIARDGAAAFSAYPDLPLSAFTTASMVYLLRARAHRSAHLYLIPALLILFCGLTKSEGKVHFLVFVTLALVPLAVGASNRPQLRSALAAFAGAGFLLVLYELGVVQPTQAGFIPDDYSQLVSWERITGNFGACTASFQCSRASTFYRCVLAFQGSFSSPPLSSSSGEDPGPRRYCPSATSGWLRPCNACRTWYFPRKYGKSTISGRRVA